MIYTCSKLSAPPYIWVCRVLVSVFLLICQARPFVHDVSEIQVDWCASKGNHSILGRKRKVKRYDNQTEAWTLQSYCWCNRQFVRYMNYSPHQALWWECKSLEIILWASESLYLLRRSQKGWLTADETCDWPHGNTEDPENCLANTAVWLSLRASVLCWYP